MLNSAVVSGPLPRGLVAQLEAAILYVRADGFRPVPVLVPSRVLCTSVARALVARDSSAGEGEA